MKRITPDDLHAIAMGSAIYGTGGGGDPYIGRLLAAETMRSHGSVPLMTLSEMQNSDWVVSVALAGAPTVLLEKLADTDALIRALRMLEGAMKIQAKAIFSAEVGGLNSVIPISVASKLGIPLLDCDTMGRAFPQLQMTLATLAGLDVGPVALSDERKNQMYIQACDNSWTEKFVRTALVQMGGAVHMALLPMTVQNLKRASVAGSISQAWRTGTALLKARREKTNPVQAILETTGGKWLHSGKIVDVQREVKDGWTLGTVLIEGSGTYLNQLAELKFQNEFLMAKINRTLACCTPDLISVLDLETGLPITVEQLSFGYRVALIGIPCVPAWRTPAAINLVGPQCFGYEEAYQPLTI